jgi:hypothetical protein
LTGTWPDLPDQMRHPASYSSFWEQNHFLVLLLNGTLNREDPHSIRGQKLPSPSSSLLFPSFIVQFLYREVSTWFLLILFHFRVVFVDIVSLFLEFCWYCFVSHCSLLRSSCFCIIIGGIIIWLPYLCWYCFIVPLSLLLLFRFASVLVLVDFVFLHWPFLWSSLRFVFFLRCLVLGRRWSAHM